MPRNAAGVMSLAAGNPVIPLTVIATSWANPTLSDIATEITNSLDRGGRGAMTAALQIIDGTLASPGLAFASDLNCGMRRSAADDWDVVVGGISGIRLRTTVVNVLAAVAGARLGIGVDPKTWANTAGDAAIQLGGRSAFASLSGGTGSYVLNNLYFDGTNWRYIVAAEASIYRLFQGTANIYTVVSGAADAVATLLERFGVENDGRIYGTQLHNNAGSVAGTTKQYFASGTYTPGAPAGTSNIDSHTFRKSTWIRVGNVVRVEGGATIDCTTANTPSLLTVNLPITSAFGTLYDCMGTMTTDSSIANIRDTGVVNGYLASAPDTAGLNFSPSTAGSQVWNYSFQYEIL